MVKRTVIPYRAAVTGCLVIHTFISGVFGTDSCSGLSSVLELTRGRDKMKKECAKDHP